MTKLSTSQQGSLGEEPDYRFTLANERTHLAWMRTSLALLAAAIVIDEMASIFDMSAASYWFAVLLAIISVVFVVCATIRWHRIQQAMRHNSVLPQPVIPWILAGCVAIFGVSCMVFILAAG